MLNNFNVTKTITILSSEWDQIFPTENLLRYGWSKVEGDDLYNFICEIKKSELNRIVQQERDFSKNMPMFSLIVELNYFQESFLLNHLMLFTAYGSNITDPLKVEKGPRFSLQPKNVVLTTRSYLPSIECVAIGNPQPTYLWQRKGHTGQVDTLVSNTAYTISNGKLTFDNTRLNETRDAGEYYCVSSNRFGSVRSEPSKVSFGSKIGLYI